MKLQSRNDSEYEVRIKRSHVDTLLCAAKWVLEAQMDSPLIEFLKNPDSYPHPAEKVTHIQTHLSHVFMAGAYVYKVKKPVNLEFLDFSTLEKRKHYCG